MMSVIGVLMNVDKLDAICDGERYAQAEGQMRGYFRHFSRIFAIHDDGGRSGNALNRQNPFTTGDTQPHNCDGDLMVMVMVMGIDED